MRDFRNLDVWHKAHAFTLQVYRATKGFPRQETFGLATTLRRGSASIAKKIAEGCGKDLALEFTGCLQQARGIGMDVEYQLLLAHDLKFLDAALHDGLQSQVIEVRRMLSGLIKTPPAPRA